MNDRNDTLHDQNTGNAGYGTNSYNGSDSNVDYGTDGFDSDSPV